MASTVGSKGQIVIEKAIRDALGLQPGYIAVQKLVEDHVEVYFYPPEHQESLRGVLADKAEKMIPPEKWSEAREEAWSKAVASEWIVSEAGE